MRKRLLDPGFFLNEELAECDPMARLLFAGLTLYCDKEGKFEWRPKRIRGAIFPHDHDIDITNLLGQLQASAFITQYNVNGNDYAIIPTFLKHQSPHIREKRSSIPDPPPEIPGNSTEFPEIPVTSVPVPIPVPVPVSKDSGVTNVTPSSSKSCPQVKIVELYHELLPELPRVLSWPEHLKAILRQRWREDPDRQNLEWWSDYFTYVKESPFLLGQKTEFVADLEWIVRPKNMTKILNGRYHQDTKTKTQTSLEVWLEIHRRKEREDG